MARRRNFLDEHLERLLHFQCGDSKQRTVPTTMPLPPDESSGPVPRPSFEHTTLGSFVAEGNLWTTTIVSGDNSLELSLAGNDSGPLESLTAAASALIARFPEVKEQALDFLVSQEEAPPREDFICEGLELLREDYPNHFSLSFILFGDLGGIWRVEFEDGEPLFLARDD